LIFCWSLSMGKLSKIEIGEFYCLDSLFATIDNFLGLWIYFKDVISFDSYYLEYLTGDSLCWIRLSYCSTEVLAHNSRFPTDLLILATRFSCMLSLWRITLALLILSIGTFFTSNSIKVRTKASALFITFWERFQSLSSVIFFYGVPIMWWTASKVSIYSCFAYKCFNS
jgi:hypothetical protein